MSATIFHNPRCSTSRKALAQLEEAGISPTVVKYLTDPPTREQLAAMIEAAGLTPAQAVRKRESLYAELNLAQASDEQLLNAMAANPILIERPFVVTEKGTRLARPLERLNEIL